MTNPTALLAAASSLDLSVYTEHATGCPLWYDEHRRARPLPIWDKPCSCGLAEQLEAVRVIAEFVRELLGQEPSGKVEATDGRHYRIMVRLSTAPCCIPTDLARRVAADLIRACAEVDARAATPEEP